MTDNLQQIASNLYNGKQDEVAALVQQALEKGMSPEEVLTGGLIAGMDEVGKDFKAGELYVPEVLIAARAMKAGMSILRPLLVESGVSSAGKCIIATVKG
ncbi:MAG: B12-binding domain-containing protein, partial [Anaerolineae bacterium]